MPSENSSDVKFEIGHLLLTDIVGYSKLLISAQTELLEHAKAMVWGSEQVRTAEAEGKLIRLATGDGMALIFCNSPKAPAQCALEPSRAGQSTLGVATSDGVRSESDGRYQQCRQSEFTACDSNSWIRR